MKKRIEKNKLRVIQISGIQGILSALFVVACLIAGFVGFPAMMLTKIWNHFAASYPAIPYINMFQGLLLWAILAISYLIVNKKQKYLMTFEPKSDRRDIKDIIREIKAQSAEKQAETAKPSETEGVKIESVQQDNENEKSKEVV